MLERLKIHCNAETALEQKDVQESDEILALQTKIEADEEKLASEKVSLQLISADLQDQVGGWFYVTFTMIELIHG